MHDLIIIGGGPAGLAAGLYAARARLDTLLFERGIPGGQIALTNSVENYPGILSISGMELAENLQRHAETFGMKTEYGTVTRVDLAGKVKRIFLEDGQEFAAKAVIIATGADHKKLGVPGEDDFAGRGVSYCAVCDGAFFRDRQIAVIGGGDSAIDEGLYLARIGKQVTVIHRRNELRAEKILQEQAFANPRMAFLWDTVVERIAGGEAVERLELRHLKTGETSELAIEGVFIYVGLLPNTGFLAGSGLLDAQGYVPSNEKMETPVPGVYAVGDIRPNTLRQVVTAAADGAIAAMQAEKYIGQVWGAE